MIGCIAVEKQKRPLVERIKYPGLAFRTNRVLEAEWTADIDTSPKSLVFVSRWVAGIRIWLNSAGAFSRSLSMFKR